MRVSSSQLFLQSQQGFQRQQANVAELQSQILAQKKYLRPSDNPTAMGRALNLEQISAQTSQFQENITVAENRIGLEETILKDVTLLLQRVRDLSIQGNNSSLPDASRQAIASEVRERISELVSLGNTVDANGDHLFAGHQGQQQPFTTTTYNGTQHINFAGDQGSRFVQVSESKQVQTSDSGFDIFFKMASSSALISEAVIANTGNGTPSPAYVFDPTQSTANNYRIDFTSPTSFDVIDEVSGNTVQSGNYTAGSRIEFDGIRTAINGTPATGDQFLIRSGKQQNIFLTMEKLAATLETTASTPADDAKTSAAMGQVIDDLANALDNVTDFRTRTGGRLNSLESQRGHNEAYELQTQKTLSDLVDLDYVEAITQLQFQMFTLEAAQASFARIEGTTLFSYLR